MATEMLAGLSPDEIITGIIVVVVGIAGLFIWAIWYLSGVNR
jgi:hypothetical protein